MIVEGGGSTLAGDCAEEGIRDGPLLFARFTAIAAIAATDALVAVACGPNRVALVSQWSAQTIATVPSGPATVALVSVGGGAALVAVGTRAGGVLLLYATDAVVVEDLCGAASCSGSTRPPHVQLISIDDASAQLFVLAGQRVARVLIQLPLVAGASRDYHSELLLQPPLPQGLVAVGLSMDMPFHIQVADAAGQGFFPVELRPCTCPAAGALLAGGGDSCVAAPSGGGTIMAATGEFRPCPPGSFASAGMAACARCPPGTFAPEQQSALCSACPAARPLSLPSRDACVAVCPPGLSPTSAAAECAPTCPAGTSLAAGGSCDACPPMTFSTSGQTECARCEDGAISIAGASACSPLQCPPGRSVRAPATVFTIAVLGLPALSLAAVPHNGTVYVGSYRGMLVLDAGGASRAVAVPEMRAMVALALSPECSTLFATDDVARLFALHSEGRSGALLLLQQPASGSPTQMMMWMGMAVAVDGHSLVIAGTTVAGARDSPGRVDGVAGEARFAGPIGPMLVAPDGRTLLVADSAALRALVIPGADCQCQADHYVHPDGACLPCPPGTSAAAGTASACTPCAPPNHVMDDAGGCAPCPNAIWWETGGGSPCTRLKDTLLAPGASGLTLRDVVSEVTTNRPGDVIGVTMRWSDYASLQTIAPLPMQPDAMLIDDAARARFWGRSPRLTPPPPPALLGRLLAPGVWYVCSDQVQPTSACACRATAELILPRGPWAASRAANALNGTPPLYVTRTNGACAPPALLMQQQPTVVPPCHRQHQHLQDVCVVGWPATYACVGGALWQPPSPQWPGGACLPCERGYFQPDEAGPCIPCPSGTFAPEEGATACLLCRAAVITAAGASECPPLEAVPAQAPPGAGLVIAPDGTLRAEPCPPGMEQDGRWAACSPCPPGTAAPGEGHVRCVPCEAAEVAPGWGSAGCVACPEGTRPSPSAAACWTCPLLQEEFMPPLTWTCTNRTVWECQRGSALVQGGLSADNRCEACIPCTESEIMVPWNPDPCPGGAAPRPYDCITVQPVAGSSAAVTIISADEIDVRYTACQGLPARAIWAAGPLPTACYFRCVYGVSAAALQEYAFYFLLRTGAALGDYFPAAAAPPKNLFPLVQQQLADAADAVCIPCPSAPCPLGTWRPLVLQQCGPPCALTEEECRGSEAGCTMRCTNIPALGFAAAPAPAGAGDACVWACPAGAFRYANQTCRACAAEAACDAGELFVPLRCHPDAFSACIPCPQFPGLATLLGSTAGRCVYKCDPAVGVPNPLFNPAGTAQPPCVPCSADTYCPAGRARSCSADPCGAAACPPPTAATTYLPSRTAACPAACLDGYHTVDRRTGDTLPLAQPFFPDIDNNTTCEPCYLRPGLPCSTTCPPSQFFDSRTQACARCPLATQCPAGQRPAACPPSGVCVQCAPAALTLAQESEAASIVDHLGPPRIPGLTLTAPSRPVSAYAVLVSGLQSRRVTTLQPEPGCFFACGNNAALIDGACRPCAELYPAAAYSAVWNASNGVRWWPRSADPPHLPPRSAIDGLPEPRAGLCWPCPPDLVTMEWDGDLCATPLLHTRPLVVPTGLQLELGLELIGGRARAPAARVLLQQQVPPPDHDECPAFSRGPSCECLPGFVRSTAEAPCTLARIAARRHCSAGYEPSQLRLQADACVVIAHTPLFRSDTEAGCPSLMQTDALRRTCACSPGAEPGNATTVCTPCAPGAFSAFVGFAPCTPCPNGTTTATLGALSLLECGMRIGAALDIAILE